MSTFGWSTLLLSTQVPTVTVTKKMAYLTFELYLEEEADLGR